jgi:hypothetical protein
MFECTFENGINWCKSAIKSDYVWFRARKELWDSFKTILEIRGTIQAPARVEIPTQAYNSIHSSLLCRSEKLSDEKQLAFVTATEEILAKCIEKRDANVNR